MPSRGACRGHSVPGRTSHRADEKAAKLVPTLSGHLVRRCPRVLSSATSASSATRPRHGAGCLSIILQTTVSTVEGEAGRRARGRQPRHGLRLGRPVFVQVTPRLPMQGSPLESSPQSPPAPMSILALPQFEIELQQQSVCRTDRPCAMNQELVIDAQEPDPTI